MVPRGLFVDVADKDSRDRLASVLQRLARAGADIVDAELPGLVEAEKGFGPITPYELKTEVPAFLARYRVGVTFEQLVAGIRSPDLVKDYQIRSLGPASPSRGRMTRRLRTFKPARWRHRVP